MIKKKKGKKRSSKKLNSKALLSNRKILFGAAIVLAIVVVAGFASFAGGAKTMGKVFSWKQGKVVEDYKVINKAPDGSAPTATVLEEENAVNGLTTTATTTGTYQYINYSPDEWGDAYLGIYTEVSTPLFASRDLKLGDTGEDVQVLKSALKNIGKFPVYRGTTDDTKIPNTKYKDILNNVHPILKTLDANNPLFDSNLTQAIDAISYPNLDSSYGTYLKDSILNEYEQVRILAMTTSAWGAPTTGKYLAFTGLKGSTSEYPIATKDSLKTQNKGKGYSVHITDFNGQKELRRSGEPVYKAYPKLAYMTPTATPEFDSRALKSGNKGADVTVLQQMLYMVAKFGPERGIATTGFRVNGTFDFATQELLKQIELYYGSTKPDGILGRRMNHLLINELMWPIYR